MPDWALILFAAALGFAFSGAVASAWAWFSSGRVASGGWLLLTAFLGVCAFGGPYLALSGIRQRWRSGELPSRWAAPLAMLCLFWSFCSGVLVIQLLWASNLLGT
jgi:hypothetical protein